MVVLSQFCAAVNIQGDQGRNFDSWVFAAPYASAWVCLKLQNRMESAHTFSRDQLAVPVTVAKVGEQLSGVLQGGREGRGGGVSRRRTYTHTHINTHK